ncbi:MerR family transcriptional regulator [Rossellomorea aquimaris]|uniref:MerR family transcriptional regulator n=1 Tax=Rossellomorea aquimaris TaxID=189382 RepID=UPI001CD4482F|nr:MerR family transcriptional regulator [Rossellomorea aquimaris]MCA1057469.1 MerR family transcriptional regulator [Rossellomorea aquimaris]
MYSISEAAELLDVSPHTLRYYEKEGIIVPDRQANGIRSYHEDHVLWLKFVIKLRETQMPISDIKQYTKLFQAGDRTAVERLAILENHQKNIQQQLETLHATNEMLETKIDNYKTYILKKKHQHH